MIPSNPREIIKQWTNVHDLSLSPSAKSNVDGYPREVWIDAAGRELIGSYNITNMAQARRWRRAESRARFCCQSVGHAANLLDRLLGAAHSLGVEFAQQLGQLFGNMASNSSRQFERSTIKDPA